MKTILVVDDEEVSLNRTKKILEKGGYRVFSSNGGSPALSTLSNNPVDLVLTDRQMPGMDGFQLLAAIKESYNGLPVVMMSACGNDEAFKLLIEFHRLGGAGFFQKPLQAENLKTIIQFALKRSIQKKSQSTRLCDDSACEKDCLFCLRIQQTDSKEDLLDEKEAIEGAITTADFNKDRESATELSKKQNVIRRKLHAMQT